MNSSLLKTLVMGACAASVAAGLTGCGGSDESSAPPPAAKAPSSVPPPISGDMPPAPKAP